MTVALNLSNNTGEFSLDASLAQTILDTISSKQDEMIVLLKRLVLAESPSTNSGSQAQVLSLLREELQQLDYDVRHIPGKSTGGHLVGRVSKAHIAQPAQLLLGHCDTVWPIGTLTTMPISIHDNIIRGPGVFDMKGGLAQMVFALKTLSELQLKPLLAPIVLINSDEEIGSSESEPHIVDLAKVVERVFVLEPALGLSGRLKTARKGVGQFEIRVFGRAAHAGLDPEKGISAVLELSHIIQKLFAMNDFEKGISVNVGLVRGGLRPNVVAPTSRAVVDVRVPSAKYAYKVEQEILGLDPTLPGVKISVEGQIDRPPLERTPANRLLWNKARNLGKALNLNLEEGLAGGASDGNLTSQHVATLDGLGAVGDGAHADHEFIFLDKMVERSALLALLILEPAH
jgi:glutamate carboxypeptidase